MARLPAYQHNVVVDTDEPARVPVLRAGQEFIDRAQMILRQEQSRLAGLLGDHELSLVGGCSVPSTLTKGDVDLHLRVPPGSFDETLTALRGIYRVVHPRIWQLSLATFVVVPATLPTGVAVTPIGSEHDRRFRHSWQLLAADASLVQAYNEMKIRHHRDTDEYERQKCAFFDMLLA
jgi:GrpB-like predicted nucleotidyltransferase (UPF0157 family)